MVRMENRVDTTTASTRVEVVLIVKLGADGHVGAHRAGGGQQEGQLQIMPVLRDQAHEQQGDDGGDQ